METELKELVPKGCFILERGWWGEAFRSAFPLVMLSSCLKVGSPCPPILPGCFPSCSALLQGLMHPFSTSFASQGGQRRGGHGAMPHKACGSWPWSQQLLLSPMPQLLPLSHKMFSLCLVAPSLQSVPGREQWDVRAGATLERCLVRGLQAPGLG